MNNELTPIKAADLAIFQPNVSLVEVRRDPVKYRRISADTKEVAVEKMLRIVYGAFLYRGQESTHETMRFIAEALVNEIMADRKYGLQSLSWLEIGMSIRGAVLGEGKELYGVSVASLYAALVDYARNEGHEACKQAKAVQASPEQIETFFK